MNYKRWFVGSLILWLFVIGMAGFLFVKGWTVPSRDSRTAVALSEAERDQILAEMRHLLQSVHGVLQGVSTQDLSGAGKSARAAGMAMAADVNPLLLVKLPLPFKAMGMSVHRDFDGLADGIQFGEPLHRLPRALSLLDHAVSSRAGMSGLNRAAAMWPAPRCDEGVSVLISCRGGRRGRALS